MKIKRNHVNFVKRVNQTFQNKDGDEGGELRVRDSIQPVAPSSGGSEEQQQSV